MTLTACPHCHDPILDGEEDYEGMHYGCFLTAEKRRDEGDRDMEADRAEAEREWREASR